MQFEDVAAIGNLLLVSASVNGKLGEKSFKAKQLILESDEGRAYDIGGVLDKDKWSREEIEARTEFLAETAYDKIWKLPA